MEFDEKRIDDILKTARQLSTMIQTTHTAMEAEVRKLRNYLKYLQQSIENVKSFEELAPKSKGCEARRLLARTLEADEH